MASGFPCIRRLAAVFWSSAILMLAAPNAHALEKATLQLKWLHHFQFAGYYMAQEKGFYRATGLDVTIKEGGPTAEVEKDVASGRADFGVGTSALLLDLAKGQEFVVLGQVFQHSPAGALFLSLIQPGGHSDDGVIWKSSSRMVLLPKNIGPPPCFSEQNNASPPYTLNDYC